MSILFNFCWKFELSYLHSVLCWRVSLITVIVLVIFKLLRSLNPSFSIFLSISLSLSLTSLFSPFHHKSDVYIPFGRHHEWYVCMSLCRVLLCASYSCTCEHTFLPFVIVWVGIRDALRRSNLKQKVTFTTPSTLRIAMHYTNKKKKVQNRHIHSSDVFCRCTILFITYQYAVV